MNALKRVYRNSSIHAFILSMYCLIAIMTFGHVMVHHSRGPMDFRVEAAFLGGMAWPLFWSWDIQSKGCPITR